MKRRKVLGLAAAAAVAPGFAHAQGGPGQRKVLRVSFRVPETTFDPARVIDLYSRNITAHIFEALYGWDPLARPIRLVPLTAVALPEHSADFRTWTIRLRPGIFFSDDPVFGGKPRELVAQDYVYSFKRVVDPAVLGPASSDVINQNMIGLQALQDEALKSRKPFDYDHEVEGLKALDRYTLRFRLEQPRPRFADFLAQSDIFGAVAREVIEHYGDEAGAHPVGTGPFRLKQWRRSSLIVLERNPQFRDMRYEAQPAADDAEGQAILARLKGRRLPIVDEVQVSVIQEDQPRWLSFLNGSLDMIGTAASPLPNDFITQAVPNGKLAPNLARQGIKSYRTLNPDVGMAVFNMEDPVVGGYTPDKLALRRAIGFAYDVEREIRLVRRNQAVPAESRLSPSVSGYDPNYHSDMNEFSPARAKALLDLYGYVDRDGDGWRERPDGSPLLLRMCTQPDQTSRQIDECWKHSMDAVGLRMQFVVAQWPENLKSVHAGRFMMWTVASTAAGPDGLDALSSMYSPQVGGQNMARFKLPEMDRLYERLSELEDGPERNALFVKAKKLEAVYRPYKDIAHRISTDLVYPWLIGYRRPVFWLELWHRLDVDLGLRAAAGH